jgi:hypothetical protein
MLSFPVTKISPSGEQVPAGTSEPDRGAAFAHRTGKRPDLLSFKRASCLPGVSVIGTVSEPGLEFGDIHCSHSESLPELLTQLRLSVLISTYQTGHLVVVAARQGRLVLTFHQFERAMGIAVKPGVIRCGMRCRSSSTQARRSSSLLRITISLPPQ